MKQQSDFLYSPPPAAFADKGGQYEKELREWHKHMSIQYALSKCRVEDVLYRWLRNTRIAKDDMARFGIKLREKWAYVDAPLNIIDHHRVIKRRSDSRLIILSEPYSTMEILQNSELIKAWQSIGSMVGISEKSGWMPRSTLMLTIPEPDNFSF